ncbi:hypothetical protein EW026_g567 [Hermanssonia centrifuga]|uniref:Phosphatidate cytidylyltransferase n=1 Tax=Hermanssonia centrifuga TaxID=98765 RepID=A0A4S4KU78_9APHY|nr:hypothetical protein EW026_g567 [Hermanssonia centrifuga]
MSRVTQTSRPSFASKAAWDALGIQSGDETDEEQIDESVEYKCSAAPLPPSKSAIKKAKLQALREKRQQERAARAAARNQANGSAKAASSPTSSPSPADSPVIETKALEVEGLVSPSDEPISNGTLHTVPLNFGANGDAHPTEQPAGVPVQIPADSVPTTSPSSVPDVEKSAPVNDEPVMPVEKPAPMSPQPAEKQEDPQDAEKAKKRQNALTRTLWTFIMIGGFLTLLLMGHAYMIVLVFICQTLVYREVTALFAIRKKGQIEEASGRDPWSKTLNWYFFAVVNYFLYGESIIYYFKHVVFSDAQLTGFATNHRFISFSLYTLGFMGFVMSLKRGHFIVNNILEGMIWLWVPASLVICNDVFAYIWGITLGRTPLIALSPKKTVEGFVGALFSTIIFGLLWGTYFMRFDYMTCPVRDLGVSAFDEGVSCVPNPVFMWKDWEMPKPLSVFLSTLLGRAVATIPYAPYQFHLFFLACFASLVAPFGGFFASGFKRAFDIKDFGHSIPGHGGMTDRMDCQFLMGVFTYVYYSSLIRENNVTVGSVLQTIVSGLTLDEQLELIADLKRYLEGQGIAIPF